MFYYPAHEVVLTKKTFSYHAFYLHKYPLLFVMPRVPLNNIVIMSSDIQILHPYMYSCINVAHNIYAMDPKYQISSFRERGRYIFPGPNISR